MLAAEFLKNDLCRVSTHVVAVKVLEQVDDAALCAQFCREARAMSAYVGVGVGGVVVVLTSRFGCRTQYPRVMRNFGYVLGGDGPEALTVGLLVSLGECNLGIPLSRCDRETHDPITMCLQQST